MKTASLVRGIAATLVSLVVLQPARASAQGSLSGQGYGYPTGELSTRAIATGGSIAEFDPASPINPASLGSWGASPINSAIRQWWGRTGFTAQYDPEYRRTTSSSGSKSNMIPRFPLLAIALPWKERLELGISAATLLDRTFSTTLTSSGTLGGTPVTGTQRVESRGSITDVRLAGAYNIGKRLSLGVGAHVLTGQNRVVSARTFTDTTEFGDVSDSTAVDFSGVAFSGGAEWRIVRGVSVAGSYRKGGTIRAERNDTTLRQATAPDRIGVGLRVDRLTGTSFTAGYSNTKWTNMRGLGVSALRVSDAPEFSFGLESLGPRLGPTQLLARLGGRHRTLPFGIGNQDVKETAIAAGLSAPINGGRAVFDFTTQRASRTLTGGAIHGAKENAWTLSFGLTVRP